MHGLTHAPWCGTTAVHGEKCRCQFPRSVRLGNAPTCALRRDWLQRAGCATPTSTRTQSAKVPGSAVITHQSVSLRSYFFSIVGLQCILCTGATVGGGGRVVGCETFQHFSFLFSHDVELKRTRPPRRPILQDSPSRAATGMARTAHLPAVEPRRATVPRPRRSLPQSSLRAEEWKSIPAPVAA